MSLLPRVLRPLVACASVALLTAPAILHAQTQTDPAHPRQRAPLTILQMNDVYSTVPVNGLGGLARVATIKRALAAEGRHPLLMIGGDGKAGLLELKRIASVLMPGSEARPAAPRDFEHPHRAAAISWQGRTSCPRTTCAGCARRRRWTSGRSGRLLGAGSEVALREVVVGFVHVRHGHFRHLQEPLGARSERCLDQSNVSRTVRVRHGGEPVEDGFDGFA